MATATVTSKGQITIPKEIRERLGLRRGDRVRFTVGDDGQVGLVAENVDVMSLFGVLAPRRRRRRALALEEIDEAMRRHAAAEVVRGLRR